MEASGIVRRVDDLGRIVIPKETRKVLLIKEGDSLEIFRNESEIILKKYSPGCTFCTSMDNLLLYKGICICGQCRNELKSLNKEK